MKMTVARGNILRRLIEKLIELDNEWLKEMTNPKQLKIHKNLSRFLNRMVATLTVFGNLAVIVLAASPRFYKEDGPMQNGNVTAKAKHVHVFSARMPLDDDEHYVIVFIMHTIAGYCSLYGHFGNDFIVLAFMIFCIQQLRILSDQIYRFRETALMRIDGEQIDLDAAIILEIKRCIRKHQTLIR